VDIEYENLGINMLAVIQTEMLTEPMAKKQGIVMVNWDLKATKLVTVYDRVVPMRQKCEEDVGKGLTEASKMYLRTERRRGDRRTMGI